ncbi:MAG: hypothetical protein AMR96_06985 [Candidatus Adiutrix intracellularis]|nr:MAG: hypothetical protein AMR96_06985 [Candidatus Adiutrix intracellularis]
MNYPTFSEVIRVKDGIFDNLALHAARMDRTCRNFFGHPLVLDLNPETLPESLRRGLVKARLVYSDHLETLEFTPYTYRRIQTLTLVTDNTLDYRYKSTDRTVFAKLLARTGAEEILIVKNGLLTDTSFSNIVFQSKSGFYTPDSYLLAGTRREYLLNQGLIHERKIRPVDLGCYSRVILINAMMDLEDGVSLALNQIRRSSV